MVMVSFHDMKILFVFLRVPIPFLFRGCFADCGFFLRMIIVNRRKLVNETNGLRGRAFGMKKISGRRGPEK